MSESKFNSETAGNQHRELTGRIDSRREKSYRNRDYGYQGERNGIQGDWIHDRYAQSSPPPRRRSRSPERWNEDKYRPGPSGYTTPPRGPAASRSGSRSTSRAHIKPPLSDSAPSTSLSRLSRAGLPKPEGAYKTLESIMEKKAIAGNFRSTFFQYLNNARHEAIDYHRYCDSQARAYVADRQTWYRFWPFEKFPNSEPQIEGGGHTKACLGATRTMFGNPSTRQSYANSTSNVAAHRGQTSGLMTGNNNQPLYGGYGLSASLSQLNFHHSLGPPNTTAGNLDPGLRQTQPSREVLYALVNAQSIYKDPGTMIIVGARPIIFLDSTFVDQTFRSFHSETSKAMAQIWEDLQCFIRYHKVAATGHLLFWAESKAGRDIRAVNVGHEFLEGWITRIQRFGQVKPSIYWHELQAANLTRLTGGLAGKPQPLQMTIGSAEKPLQTAAGLAGKPPQTIVGPAGKPLPAITNPTGNILSSSIGSAEKPFQISNASVQPQPSKETSGNQILVPKASIILTEPQAEVDNWAEYKAAFKPSDVDVLLMEETVKSEGKLRMVLDEETREIITLQKLLRRVVSRSNMKKERVPQEDKMCL